MNKISELKERLLSDGYSNFPSVEIIFNEKRIHKFEIECILNNTIILRIENKCYVLNENKINKILLSEESNNGEYQIYCDISNDFLTFETCFIDK